MGSVLPQAEVKRLMSPSPVLFIGSEHVPPAGADLDLARGCLRPDDRDGMRQVVDHLIERGYRSVAYVSGSSGATQIIRRDALIAALAEHGRGRTGRVPCRRRRRRRASRGRDARSATIRPDVVVCYDDKTALFLMDELRSAGVTVPADVGIVGFDDTPFARISNPRLTTVSQRSDDLGRISVDFLLSTLERGKLPRLAADAGLARRSRNHTGPGRASPEERQSIVNRQLHRMATRRGLPRSAELPGRRRRSSCGAAAVSQPSPRRSTRVGRERVEVWRREGIEIGEHPYPDDAYATGCGWPVAFTVDVDPAWSSGFYEVSLQADGETGEEATRRGVLRRPAVVADRHRPTPSSCWPPTPTTPTTQWGGKCLYSGAVKVSFDRPLERGYLRRPAAPDEVEYDGRMASLPEEPDEEHMQLQEYLADFEYPMWCASGSWHNWERRFVRWAENEGLTLDYAVNSDLEFHPEVLDGQRLMLSVGHDEYWSWGMRDRADAFVEARRVVAIFSGNTCFWQVRYEDDGRTMVGYKGTARIARILSPAPTIIAD